MVAACRQAARQIAEQVTEQIAGRTTVSVERSVTRLLGVDGADALEVPLPNVLVDHVHDGGGLGRGIAYWLGNAMIQTGRSPQQIAEAVSAGELDLSSLELAEEPRDPRAGARGVRGATGRDRAPLRGARAMRERLGESADAAALRAHRDRGRLRGRGAREGRRGGRRATSSR